MLPAGTTEDIRGFTILEVVIGLLIFSLAATAVFYFFSGSLAQQEKLRDEYRLLRIARETIDLFLNNETGVMGDSGRIDRGRFVIRWHSYPVDQRTRVPYTGRNRLFSQLKLVHLVIFDNEKAAEKKEFQFYIQSLSAGEV